MNVAAKGSEFGGGTMNLLATVLHIMVATACMEISSATCSSQVTCPCGTTGQNFTYCSSHLSQSDDICAQWARCQKCHPYADHCTECPPGYTGPTCSQVPSRKSVVRPKRQVTYNTRRYSKTGRQNTNRFSGGSATCPNLKNTELVALRCTDLGYLRTCHGRCLTGYAFKGREDENEIEMRCQRGTWSPTQTFPDCISSGECEIALTGQGGGSYNCSMEMDGTRCDVICDGRRMGRFFCYPGKEWEPNLPYCVRRKRGSSEGRSRCECQNGGTCDSNGRCVCPTGRGGTKCEEVYCPDPGSVSNAYIFDLSVYPRGYKVDYKVGSTLSFGCYRGFEMQGDMTITCQSSGTWTRKPTCIRQTTTTMTTTTTTTTTTPAPVNCKEPGLLDNAYSQNARGVPASSRTAYRPGETVWFYCNEGFTMQGSDSITCQLSGKWTKKPTCIRQTTTTTTTTTTTPAPVYCRDPGPLANGHSLDMLGDPTSSTAVYRPGEIVWYYCNEGFKMEGPDSVTCRIPGRWTRKPICIRQPTTTTTTTTPAPIFCSAPPKVQNANSMNMFGIPTSPSQTFRPAQLVYYSCNQGYIMQGSDTITCQSSGRWTRSPLCTRQTTTTTTPSVICPDPGSVRNADRVNINGPSGPYSVYFPGDAVLYTCKSGFALEGAPYLTCQSSGRWSNPTPTCFVSTPRSTTTTEDVPERCPDPGRVANGDRESQPPIASRVRSRSFRVGTMMTYSCDAGYQLQGTASMYCLYTGAWSSQRPTCEAGEPTGTFCRDPGPIRDGKVMVLPPAGDERLPVVEHSVEYLEGTTLEYECEEGYSLIGSFSITCGTDGFWSAVAPSCFEDYESYCDNPGPLANGQVVIHPSQGQWPQPAITDEGFREETRLQFYCDRGYKLIGLPHATCGSEGMWSTSFPYCEKENPSPEELMYCKNPGRIANGEVLPNLDPRIRPAPADNPDEYPQYTRITYACDEGYTLKGESEITCGVNGFWSARKPSCEGECGKSTKFAVARITNGKPTVAGEWPWMVAIATVSSRGEPFIECGGVLIDRRHILTAAHCFDSPGSFELYFGKYHRSNARDDNNVLKRTNLTTTIHPHYNHSTYDSDIALVRFSPDIKYSTRIQPICLPTPETTADNIRLGKNGVVTGWGLNERGLPSESLFMANLPVLPGDHCAKAYQKRGQHFPITSNMYCAGFEKGGTSACTGDSGSPMVFYDSFSQLYTLEGLVSFGVRDECSEPERYTIITKVLPYLPWVIRTKMMN